MSPVSPKPEHAQEPLLTQLWLHGRTVDEAEESQICDWYVRDITKFVSKPINKKGYESK